MNVRCITLCLISLLSSHVLYGAHDVETDDQKPLYPNVLFISVDDLNNWVGYLKGHPQVRTPNIDRLVQRGVAFTNAHCTTPLCQPSRTAVLTGLTANETNVYGNGDTFDYRSYTMLPQYFAAHGYSTYGTGKIHHKKSVTHAIFQETYTPEQRWSPFDSDDVDYTKKELKSKASPNPCHMIEDGPGGKRYVLPFNRMPSERSPHEKKGESFDWAAFDLPDAAFGDSKIVDWSIKKMMTHESDDPPFFMAVGFYRPHIPLYAPQPYFDHYPLADLCLPETRADDLQDVPVAGKLRALNAVTAGTHAHVMKHTQWKHAVQAYLASISFIDHQVGRLLDYLDESPHTKHTIVVLFSDHGWHLGEKQAWGKQSGWIHSTQVPLIVWSPLTTANHICHETVSLLDLYPTLVDLAGLPPRELHGVSLMDLLSNPSAETPRVVTTYITTDDYVLSSKQWRYIRYGDGGEELYDIIQDPREYHNLATNPSLKNTITDLKNRAAFQKTNATNDSANE